MKTIGNIRNFWLLPKEPQKDLGNIWNKPFIYFYYLDTSVLLENIPLVKFIKTTSGTRVVCESRQASNYPASMGPSHDLPRLIYWKIEEPLLAG